MKKYRCWETIFDISKKEEELEDINKKLQDQDIWKDIARTKPLIKAKQSVEDLIGKWKIILRLQKDISEYLSIYDSDQDESYISTINDELKILEKSVNGFALLIQFKDDIDLLPAFLEIHPGAGGTESQDWANMLFRMYSRWAETSNYKSEIIELQDGEEAGIKRVIIRIDGNYAYGKLKSEKGIHRLVRISPFDANKRRHTSFASVDVFPDIEDNIEIEIEDKDIRIDTFRASGAGGQHINVTDSAVRITHLPTNLVVTCQNERSQHRNKDSAMKILRGRLYDYYKEEKDKEIEKMKGEKREISWGNQIRSYTLAPYQLIKDHRTGYETGNVQRVLNGDIDDFIEAYLLKNMSI